MRPHGSSVIASSTVLAVLLGGCHHRSLQPTTASETSATATPPTRSPAPVSTIPSFHRDVLPVLVRHCASASGCHGEAPTDSVSLDLRPPGAYAQLVNALAQARPGGIRVKPGDDDASFLVAKLTGKLVGPEGKPMPIDPESGVPIVPSPLPPDFIDGMLRPWIRAGAPDN